MKNMFLFKNFLDPKEYLFFMHRKLKGFWKIKYELFYLWLIWNQKGNVPFYFAQRLTFFSILRIGIYSVCCGY